MSRLPAARLAVRRPPAGHLLPGRLPCPAEPGRNPQRPGPVLGAGCWVLQLLTIVLRRVAAPRTGVGADDLVSRGCQLWVGGWGLLVLCEQGQPQFPCFIEEDAACVQVCACV